MAIRTGLKVVVIKVGKHVDVVGRFSSEEVVGSGEIVSEELMLGSIMMLLANLVSVSVFGEVGSSGSGRVSGIMLVKPYLLADSSFVVTVIVTNGIEVIVSMGVFILV